MYSPSTFSQIVKLLDREQIKQAIVGRKSDKYSKGFTTWNHLMAFLFAQFAGSRSLRDLVLGFNAKPSMHYHIRSNPLRRSTLSDANSSRSSDVFKDMLSHLIHDNKEIRTLVHIFDSSIIRVDGRGSEWTEEKKTRHGQGLKLHIDYGPEESSIENCSITSTNVNDITVASQWNLSSGKIYIFDKGYCDYNWWHKIHTTQSHFITRSKSNAVYHVLEERDIRESDKELVRRDSIIMLSNKRPRAGKVNHLAATRLRLIEVVNPDDKKIYYFITNMLEAEAAEIAAYYKGRWGIELLFKWLKQHLTIGRFLGENENAIRIQVYVAMIAFILLGKLKKICAFPRMLDLLSLVRIALLSHDIPLKPPSHAPPTNPPSSQLSLELLP